ncbi:MAG: 2-phospho-L-lactate guanylyltransferase [Mycobacteriales bacterium]
MPDWSVVVPVKRLEVAKSRLRSTQPGADHDGLVLAICTDTVLAALACAEVALVVVVTDDARAATALRQAGAVIVADEPDAGLNPAVEHGAAQAATLGQDHAVAVLSADLPALRPAELAAALNAASAHPRAFVSDAARTGTTLLTVAPGGSLGAAYGADSSAAHAASGAVELTGDWPSLRRDVDTADDLRAAAALGLGRHTAALLRAGPPRGGGR